MRWQAALRCVRRRCTHAAWVPPARALWPAAPAAAVPQAMESEGALDKLRTKPFAVEKYFFQQVGGPRDSRSPFNTQLHSGAMAWKGRLACTSAACAGCMRAGRRARLPASALLPLFHYSAGLFAGHPRHVRGQGDGPRRGGHQGPQRALGLQVRPPGCGLSLSLPCPLLPSSRALLLPPSLLLLLPPPPRRQNALPCLQLSPPPSSPPSSPQRGGRGQVAQRRLCALPPGQLPVAGAHPDCGGGGRGGGAGLPGGEVRAE